MQYTGVLVDGMAMILESINGEGVNGRSDSTLSWKVSVLQVIVHVSYAFDISSCTVAW